jgi:hypothetical protein
MKKMKKRQIKQRLRQSSLMCSELEEYLFQSWSPYVLEKLDSRVSKGTAMFASLFHEVDQNILDMQKYVEVSFHHLKISLVRRLWNKSNTS